MCLTGIISTLSPVVVFLKGIEIAMAAVQYKLEGNRLFSQKKYEEAIKQYTKAIVSRMPFNPVLFIKFLHKILPVKNVDIFYTTVTTFKVKLDNSV